MSVTNRRTSGVIALAAIMVAAMLTATATAGEKLTDDERMAWWRDGRFGMFIHWGLYSVAAGTYDGKRIPGIGEWIMERGDIPVAEYEKFAAQFNPVKFDADEWVRIAKDAGMKYIVITSKHHDGFCLWDSKVSEYDIMDASPFKRDILKELTDACNKHGVQMCFYYSIMDWHHPEAQAPFYPTYNNGGKSNPNFARYVETYMKPQLKELVTRYNPGVLWFDGEWTRDWTEPQGEALYNWLREMKPDLIINNRVGKGRKGMQGLTEEGAFAGDFGTPEQEIPARGLPGVDWETCMTMNDTWGYKSYDDNWKSSDDLLHKLADIASKGGNFLLNVGPTSEGLIPGPSVERLAAVGKWMAKNGESIYGTTASPLGILPFGRCTARQGKLYLHVFDWPKNGKLTIAQLKNKVNKAYLLADGKQLKVDSSSFATTTIEVPSKAPDPVNTVIVIEIEGKPEVLDIQAGQAQDGTIACKAVNAKIHGDNAKYESGGGKDNIGFWTNPNDYVSWNFAVQKPGTFNVEITYAADGSGGTEYVVEVAGKELAGTTKGTGGWSSFTSEKLGTVNIARGGEYTLKVVPKKMVGAVMNLKSVKLTPVGR